MNIKLANRGFVITVALLVVLYAISGQINIDNSMDLLEFSQPSLYVDDSGTTRVQWAGADKRQFRCQFSESVTSAYRCGIDLNLTQVNSQGIDFTQYENIKLKLHYQGPATRLRIAFRNRFQQPQMPENGKQHQVILALTEGRHSFKVPLDNFFVPRWWVQQYSHLDKIDLREQRNNVIHAGFDVETPMPKGEHLFEIKAFAAAQRVRDSWVGIGFLGTALVLGLLATFFVYHMAINAIKNRFDFGSRQRTATQEQDTESFFAMLDGVQRANDLQMDQRAQAVLDDETQLLPWATTQLAIAEYSKTQEIIGTGILAIAIDQMKNIRAKYDTEGENEVLKAVNRAVKAQIIAANITSKWESDKVLVISPNVYPTEAFDIAERLINDLKNLQLSMTDIKTTASIGVVNIVDNESFEDALLRVEKALTSAQEVGGDTVCRLR